MPALSAHGVGVPRCAHGRAVGQVFHFDAPLPFPGLRPASAAAATGGDRSSGSDGGGAGAYSAESVQCKGEGQSDDAAWAVAAFVERALSGLPENCGLPPALRVLIMYTRASGPEY